MINTDSATNEGDDGFALVTPLNDQLVCELCEDCTLDAHEDEDGQLVRATYCVSVRVASGGITRIAYKSESARPPRRLIALCQTCRGPTQLWLSASRLCAAGSVSRMTGGVSARWGNPCSRLAALGAQRGPLLTLSSHTFTPTRACRRPASCTFVSLRERIGTVTSRMPA